MSHNKYLLALIISFFILKCTYEKSQESSKVVLNSMGDTLQIINYKGNVLDGWQKEFYENHQIKSYGTYKNGVRNGVFADYHDDGTIARYGYFENDTLWYQKRFNTQGILIKEGRILSFISPKETHENNLCLEDSMLISYKLYHSMARRPGLRLILVDLIHNDTIIDVNSQNPFVEYYYKDIIKGRNRVLVTLHELNEREEIMGIKSDTLDFQAAYCSPTRPRL